MSLQLETLQWLPLPLKIKAKGPLWPITALSSLWSNLLFTPHRVGLLASSQIPGTRPPLSLCIGCSLCLEHSLTSFGRDVLNWTYCGHPILSCSVPSPSYSVLLFALFCSTFNILYDLSLLVLFTYVSQVHKNNAWHIAGSQEIFLKLILIAYKSLWYIDKLE